MKKTLTLFSMLATLVALSTGCPLPSDPQSNGACVESCSTDNQCMEGQWCLQGKCQQKASFCVAGNWSMNDRGETEYCGAYTCDESVGKCRKTADTDSQCNLVDNFAWDGQTGCHHICETVDPGQPCGAPPPSGPGTSPSYGDVIACKTDCTKDTDCGSGMCYHGKCQLRTSYCELSPQAGYISVTPLSGQPDEAGNLPRARSVCEGGFSCNAVSGECNTACVSGADCDGGHICNTSTRRCVVPGAGG